MTTLVQCYLMIRSTNRDASYIYRPPTSQVQLISQLVHTLEQPTDRSLTNNATFTNNTSCSPSERAAHMTRQTRCSLGHSRMLLTKAYWPSTLPLIPWVRDRNVLAETSTSPPPLGTIVQTESRTWSLVAASNDALAKHHRKRYCVTFACVGSCQRRNCGLGFLECATNLRIATS
mmetsp:Transcript_30506/g.48780  ORF Transcript_30506/g.48780 Transcript_30506/m.48780 type:complete len:175 (+) Transcript_30506:3720-4244(+)